MARTSESRSTASPSLSIPVMLRSNVTRSTVAEAPPQTEIPSPKAVTVPPRTTTSRPWTSTPDEPPPTLYRPVGCSACSKTGYKGRLALHEVMAVSEEIEKLAVEHASALTIIKVALEQGMITLRNDGLTKVKAGHTSMEEILRVVV